MPLIPLSNDNPRLGALQPAFSPYMPVPTSTFQRAAAAPARREGGNSLIPRGGTQPNSAPVGAVAPISGAYNQQPEYDRLMSQYDSLIGKVGGSPSQVPLPHAPRN